MQVRAGCGETGVRRRAAAAAALLVVLLAGSAGLTGCGVGLPREVGPRGVDGLVVPSPTPDPGDYVEGVDNPWLPLEPGRRRHYEVVGGGPPRVTVTATVAPDRGEVAGVPTTVVREVVRERAPGGAVEVSRVTRTHYAQDEDGNVWTFGERTTVPGDPSATTAWEVGTDGAAAGLAMPAGPRVGDGYELEAAPGVAQERARVLTLEASRATPYGSWDDLLQTEVTTPLDPAAVEQRFHARGVGLVLVERPGDELVELVSVRDGP